MGRPCPVTPLPGTLADHAGQESARELFTVMYIRRLHPSSGSFDLRPRQGRGEVEVRPDIGGDCRHRGAGGEFAFVGQGDHDPVIAESDRSDRAAQPQLCITVAGDARQQFPGATSEFQYMSMPKRSSWLSMLIANQSRTADHEALSTGRPAYPARVSDSIGRSSTSRSNASPL